VQTYPLLWHSSLDALVEVLLALAQFSGDGRHAALEVTTLVVYGPERTLH
jgi:hypothetical protein